MGEALLAASQVVLATALVIATAGLVYFTAKLARATHLMARVQALQLQLDQLHAQASVKHKMADLNERTINRLMTMRQEALEVQRRIAQVAANPGENEVNQIAEQVEHLKEILEAIRRSGNADKE